MTELMDTLYNCVSKAIAEDILNEDGEYLIRISRHENEVKRLSNGLDKIIASRVDELLAEQLVIEELREYAYFRAGFQLAAELMRS